MDKDIAPRPSPIAFRDKVVEAELGARVSGSYSPSQIAARDLDRYYTLLRRSLPTFTEAEACLIVDACSDWHVEPHSASLLWAQVDDAIRNNGLDGKWHVDGATLTARLRILTPFESLAVVDAVERFWCGDHSDMPANVRRVGLVKT